MTPQPRSRQSGPLGAKAKTEGGRRPGPTGFRVIPHAIYSIFGSEFQYVGNIRIDGATKDQALTLMKAHREARVQIDAAIRTLESAKHSPNQAASIFFKISSTKTRDIEDIETLIERFKKMRKDLNDVTYDTLQQE